MCNHTYTVVEKGHIIEALLVKTDSLLGKVNCIFFQLLQISHCSPLHIRHHIPISIVFQLILHIQYPFFILITTAFQFLNHML